ncbi:hypothetical protein CONLIGDRAFT_686899 [Coniochaeta ligniaria NRRL 30616]|uniref:Uncharacterized protein n=1 Tax=Coniochaeta ligniaria NRRL 30616 TaxID=1408157 RepID=A0A1J7IZT5_9PEZI|nr:hypothetical protein CONLIGDRAFT_686899 [Coniochaeta ligniaria NRRL 30616]
MSDCLICAILFATHTVLGRNYTTGTSPQDLLELSLAAVNTSILLLCSIAHGLSMLKMQRNAKAKTRFWLAVTGVFSAVFIGFKHHELVNLVHKPSGPTRGAFLRHDYEAGHGIFNSHMRVKIYMRGFILPVILTAIPFWLVMTQGGRCYQPSASQQSTSWWPSDYGEGTGSQRSSALLNVLLLALDIWHFEWLVSKRNLPEFQRLIGPPGLPSTAMPTNIAL